MNLKGLNLNNTKIDSLPSSIGELKKLEWLELDDTLHLFELPEEFFNLSSLNTLYLGGSSLMTLPSNFGDLEDLSELYLNRTKITSFPTSIGSLQLLHVIEISSWGEIEELSKEFWGLSNLVSLTLDATMSSIPGT